LHVKYVVNDEYLMFEAKLAEAMILKKIVEAIKDLVTDVNIDATPNGKLYLSLS
jgi:hypothetical protein